MLKVQTLKSASRIKMSAWCASAPGRYFHLCATSPKSQTGGSTWGVPSWGVGTGSPASLWDRGRAKFSRSALGDWVEDRDTKGMQIARRSATTCKHTTRTSIIQVRRSSFHSLCYLIGVRVKVRSVWNKNIGPVWSLLYSSFYVYWSEFEKQETFS